MNNITNNDKINNGTKYGGPFVTNPTNISCDISMENEYFFSGDYIKKINCNIFYI